jgi:nitroreductase
MELDKAIKSRKSVRKFNNKKPNWKDIVECIDAARFAPTAGNNFTLKFILIDDEEKIQKLAEASQQDFIAQAKYVVAVCSNSARLKNAYEERGEKFNHQQVGAAIENFLLKVQEKKLSTCWIGYFVEEQVKKILAIPVNIEVEALFPIGYEKEKPTTKRLKIDMDSILYFDSYNEKRMKPLKRVD